MFLGLIGALFRISSNRVLNFIGFIYVWIIRGTPLMVQLFILYFGLPQVGIKLSSMTAGILGLAINTGAYVSEILRAGIQAVDNGQMEAAQSLGMSYSKAMTRIIAPQAIKISIPPLVNQFIMTLKNSSIASLVTITELLQTGLFLLIKGSSSKREVHKSFSRILSRSGQKYFSAVCVIKCFLNSQILRLKYLLRQEPKNS